MRPAVHVASILSAALRQRGACVLRSLRSISAFDSRLEAVILKAATGKRVTSVVWGSPHPSCFANLPQQAECVNSGWDDEGEPEEAELAVVPNTGGGICLPVPMRP